MAGKQKSGFFSRLFGRSKDKEWVYLYQEGEKYLSEKKLHKALDNFESALEITREIGDRMAEGYQLKMLGGVSYQIGEEQNDIGYLNKAIEYGEKAVEIAQEIDDKTLEGSALGVLGNAYLIRKDMHSASKMVGTKEKPILRLNADGLQNLAGDNILASQYFEKSVAAFRETENLEGTASALYFLAISLKKMGQAASSLRAAREASQLWSEMGSPMLKYSEKFISEYYEKK